MPKNSPANTDWMRKMPSVRCQSPSGIAEPAAPVAPGGRIRVVQRVAVKAYGQPWRRNLVGRRVGRVNRAIPNWLLIAAALLI